MNRHAMFSSGGGDRTPPPSSPTMFPTFRGPRARARSFGLACAALLIALPVAGFAQLEISGGTFTPLIAPSAPPSPIAIQPQFAGEMANAGGSASRSTSATLTARYPSSAVGGIVLQRSSIGTTFAGGVSRYRMGEVIIPPAVDATGVGVAAAGYWRAEPVKAGEIFSQPGGAPASETPLAAGTARNFYYSPHAERVFATQSGRVAVKWVTRAPIAIPGDTNLRYRFRDEIFAVSPAPGSPLRRIFWTERGFNSPVVTLPSGKIETVNPVYSSNFPATVTTEYQPVGNNPPDPASAPPAEKRTLWASNIAGILQIHAYNLEGRIFVEYLGALKAGTNAQEFLGADIVEVVRSAPSTNVSVNLGEQLTPRDSLNRMLPLDDSSEWLASPVLDASPNSATYYGSTVRADGRTVYYAERENDSPDRVVFYWLEQSDAAIHFLSSGKPNLNIYWPQHRNSYLQVWPSNLSAFAHYTVATPGSTAETGLQFPAGQVPQVIYQDDPTQTQAVLDITTQRLTVTFAGDSLNRTLLKFTNGSEVWYVRVYAQADGRAGFQENDSAAAINASAVVGTRIEPPAGYERAGYIADGTGYLPSAYINPFATNVAAAGQGAIIPVNAVPGNNVLKVWWFKRIDAPSAAFQPFYAPSKIGRYTVSYPTSPATIVLASNSGSGDLAPDEIQGTLYVQNDRLLPGFNPNEEHAMVMAGRIYALRDDLNDTTADATPYTSEPYALLRYTAAADSRPAMKVFKILRELDLDGTANDVLFSYPITAGTIIQAPMPLPLLPQPISPDGTVRNREVQGTPDPTPVNAGPSYYESFSFADRKGFHWIYRGPHDTGAPTFGMQFYYTMREGFYVPGVAAQPAVGTILPYLRPLVSGVAQGDAITGTSATIIYRPTWPANAPELRVGETLALPKFGLPAVMPQASTEVIYQQSLAIKGMPSVALHDPFREKTYALGTAGGLAALPASILTTTYQGRTYFQRLPPHLQKRFFLDPLRGTAGALVLAGQFVDEIAGEDYIHLNTLSLEDVDILKALPGNTNNVAWNTAIDHLSTSVETFVPDPAKIGAYKSDGRPVSVGPTALPHIYAADSAVVDYALTATGRGNGWVTLMFGNGRAFTPQGEPVVMKIIKVSSRLYDGELKVLPSANPLDEQVVLRHTGDFAARPQDYIFEWRYASPDALTGAAPGVYTQTMTPWSSGHWMLAANPPAALPAASAYGTAVALPHGVQINSQAPVGNNPGLVAKAVNSLIFTGSVSQRVVFSADIEDRTGFVLYVNGVAALAYQAPASFTSIASTTGLVPGALHRQFLVDSNYFSLGANRIEVALFTSADLGNSSTIDFRIDYATSTDLVVAAGSPWLTPNGTLTNQATVGGSPSSPLGSPLLMMSDTYFTMRYRAVDPLLSVTGDTWSNWMPPKLVEGWIKRVLAAINPFNQRMRDLYNNSVNTDVSILTQAGKRWEGDIALTLESINDFGLIEIYETVLNRGRSLTIDSNFDYGPANDALLLAAGYLADLYTIAGNEAYADAANPTISLDATDTTTEINTSRFSFESQVKSVAEEELALLRGRDDFLAPSIATAPAYNRLYWNYTRGINSGEALYAVNYNIREKSGSTTADGIIDAADAQRMFPQGHGDAYGHYLTALTGYYRLLRNPNFTWTPRSEAVTVLGQTVQVDYFDERKFAAAAGSLARAAQQVIALTHRQSYKDSPAAGWAHFRDGKMNAATGNQRFWGLDEWASRATQGAYINWVVGNALLPDVDNQPSHTGIQVIDRQTVPELQELTILAADFQTRMDNANARLNPLGLSPSAIAFDISPSELKAGKSHYEQIYDRSLRAVLNAKGAFDQAARMTRLLRNQENQIANSNDSIVDQERAFEKQLTDIYGTPYAGDIGAGKTYAQGYSGPDDVNWFVVDRPSDLVDTSKPITMDVRVPTQIASFSSWTIGNFSLTENSESNEILKAYNAGTVVRKIAIQPTSLVQYSDNWFGDVAAAGNRKVTGTLQQALVDVHQAYAGILQGNDRIQHDTQLFLRSSSLAQETYDYRYSILSEMNSTHEYTKKIRLASSAFHGIATLLKGLAQFYRDAAGAVAEFPPAVVGLANDATSSLRGTIKLAASTGAKVSTGLSATAEVAGRLLDVQIAEINIDSQRLITQYGFTVEQAQVVFEAEKHYRTVLQDHHDLARLCTEYQRAVTRLNNIMAEGDRIRAEREIFRRRAAALIQGYRTRDLTFRTFRNEALEQYRTLFDLASRYTYLSAKSYDYETGLLGSTAGQTVIDGIVSSRALGDLTGGVPQATVSTLGDSGLAGTMARMQSDWSVAKGRLGINNPDTTGTLFSLRRELFRILGASSEDAAWQQTLEQHIVSNLLTDPDVAAYCRNLRNADGSAVPGIVIPFSTTVRDHFNFFNQPLAAGDHAFTPSNFATKIYSVGAVLRGYIGMDPFTQGTPNAGVPNGADPKALSASPYVYLIPTGTDYMLAPPLGDTGEARAFTVRDQALPLPFNLGATQFSSSQFYNANGTLTEAPWVLRKHQSFRPVNDPAFFYTLVPTEFTNSRLVGRSVWNTGWKLVIPAKTLLANEQDGLNRFVASVKDIEIFLRTYSHSGN